jgi:hypothetical protein
MMTTRSNTIASVGATIYESPDGGKTVYARQRGSSDRVLVTKNDADTVKSSEIGKWQNRIKDIVELSHTTPALKDQLEKLHTIYLLVKNEND